MLISGKEVAAKIRADLKDRIEFVMDAGAPRPKLAIVTVGDDPGSAVYVRQKEKAAQEVGISVEHITCDSDATTEEVKSTIEILNVRTDINGIIVQLPLPTHFTKAEVNDIIDTIDPAKDVDGLTTETVGKMWKYDGAHTGFLPCTAEGIWGLLSYYGVEMCGKTALIIGRSQIVGKPIVNLLLDEDMTIMWAHSKTPHGTLVELAKRADIIISATGKPGLLAPDEINPDSVIIDVGITRVSGDASGGGIKQTAPHLVGDLYPTINETNCRAITPVPGGVGPMTVALLMSNVYDAYAQQNKL